MSYDYSILPPLWWPEFVARLEGPECCNIHEDDEGRTRFTCNGTEERPFATRILLDMGFDGDALEETMALFSANGGYCDCEIVWNVIPRARLSVERT